MMATIPMMTMTTMMNEKSGDGEQSTGRRLHHRRGQRGGQWNRARCRRCFLDRVENKILFLELILAYGNLWQLIQGVSKKTEFSGLLVLPVVCHLQYRPMGLKIFLFILHRSKKIVKNFQAKIQFEKYQNSKKSKNYDKCIEFIRK